MTFLSKQSSRTLLVYYCSLILERLLIQLNGNLYKEQLHCLILGNPFNVGSSSFTLTQKVQLEQWLLHKLFSTLKRSKTRLPSTPYLFVLAVELLAYKIRQDKEIQGIEIFGKEVKSSQLADDTTLLNSNCNSVKKSNRCTRQLW